MVSLRFFSESYEEPEIVWEDTRTQSVADAFGTQAPLGETEPSTTEVREVLWPFESPRVFPFQGTLDTFRPHQLASLLSLANIHSLAHSVTRTNSARMLLSCMQRVVTMLTVLVFLSLLGFMMRHVELIVSSRFHRVSPAHPVVTCNRVQSLQLRRLGSILGMPPWSLLNCLCLPTRSRWTVQVPSSLLSLSLSHSHSHTGNPFVGQPREVTPEEDHPPGRSPLLPRAGMLPPHIPC